MAKVLLLSTDEGFRRRHEEALAAAGFDVVALKPSWPACYERVKRERPDAAAIDLGADPGMARQTALGLRESKATAALPLVLVRVEGEDVAELIEQIPRTLIVSEENLATGLQRTIPAKPDRRPHAPASHSDEEDPELLREADAVARELTERGERRHETQAERFARITRDAIASVAHQATAALERAGKTLSQSAHEIAGERPPAVVVRLGPAAEPKKPRKPAVRAAAGTVAKAAKIAAGTVIGAVVQATHRGEDEDEEPRSRSTRGGQKREAKGEKRTRKTAAKAQQTLAVAAIVATEATRRATRRARSASEAAKTTSLVAKAVSRNLASDAEDQVKRVRSKAATVARAPTRVAKRTAAVPATKAAAGKSATRPARKTAAAAGKAAPAARGGAKTARNATGNALGTAARGAGKTARKAATNVRDAAIAADRLAAASARKNAQLGREAAAVSGRPAPRTRAAPAATARNAAAPKRGGAPASNKKPRKH